MQKKKFNILDLAICLVLICSVCLIIFRDTVSEIFEEPQMVTLEVTVEFRGEDTIKRIGETKSATVEFEPENGGGNVIVMNIGEMTILPGSVTVPEYAKVELTCVGYKKLGRYYTENGERIYVNTDSAFTLDGVRTESYTVSAEKTE